MRSWSRAGAPTAWIIQPSTKTRLPNCSTPADRPGRPRASCFRTARSICTDSPSQPPTIPTKIPWSCTPFRSFMPTDGADRLHHRAMAGWPLPACEIRVVDTQMQDVPRDMEAIGEVVIRGDNVMDGYYKEPEGTAAVMSGAWLHTGDMAVWDDENYIHIV